MIVVDRTKKISVVTEEEIKDEADAIESRHSKQDNSARLLLMDNEHTENKF